MGKKAETKSESNELFTNAMTSSKNNEDDQVTGSNALESLWTSLNWWG